MIRFLSRLSQAVILLLACSRMLTGEMSLGIVQAFFQYINLAAEPLTETSYMINSLQSALASAERAFEFLDGEEEIPDTQGPKEPVRARGEIAFEHVSFGYFPDKQAWLRGLLPAFLPGQSFFYFGKTDILQNSSRRRELSDISVPSAEKTNNSVQCPRRICCRTINISFVAIFLFRLVQTPVKELSSPMKRRKI